MVSGTLQGTVTYHASAYWEAIQLYEPFTYDPRIQCKNHDHRAEGVKKAHLSLISFQNSLIFSIMLRIWMIC